MIRSIIVDDEPHAVELLEILLEENCPLVEILAKAYSVEEAFEKINRLRPDVVFLDIKLRLKTAFDLLNRFENIFFQVVFTTAYDHYALRAFEYSAIHYLMKPIDVDKLETTVKRLESRMLHLQFSGESNQGRDPELKRLNKIGISTHTTMEFIELSDIEYLSAEGSYTCIHLVSKEEKMSSKILGYYDSILDPGTFCRIHRKFIVNINHIVRIDKAKTLTLALSSGTLVQVTPIYREELLDLLKRRVSF